MKKFGLFLAGAVALLIFLANFAPLLVMVVTLGLTYLVFKEFLKAKSTGGKITWALIGLVLLSTSIANIPSIIALVAVFVLYFVYKKWNEQKDTVVVEEQDPFASFEKEWENLNKY